MIGHHPLELLARILAALVAEVQQAVGLASAPDRHDESVDDELRRHLSLHRPADDAPREQVDGGGNIEPTFGGPEWSMKRRCASPPRTVRAPFSAYGSLFKLGPWP